VIDKQAFAFGAYVGDVPRSGDSAMGAPNVLERVFGHLRS